MIPVSVRLANRSVDRHITAMIGDWSFRSIDPGGFHSASLQLQRPIDRSDPMLAQYTRVYFYNHNGNVLWEGRLQIPGRAAGDQGQVWSLSALGPSAHTLDRTVPLIYIDKDLTRWLPSPVSSSGARVGVDTDPLGSEVQALRCQFPGGQVITTGSAAALTYDAIHDAGMQIGAVGFSWNAGKVDANYLMQAYTGFAGARVSEAIDAAAINGSAVGAQTNFVITDFPSGRTYLGFRLRRNAGGATTVADDNTWLQFWNVRVLGRRMTKAGVLVDAAGMFTTTRVLASEVVADLLGRLLTQYDGANATVTVTAKDIDQLAYPDGVSPAQVLEDLLAIEGDYTWHAWESNAAGKYRFEFIPKPTTVRYEATVQDGADFAPPSWDAYDRVTVRWRDVNGASKVTTRTQVVPALADEGLTREAHLNLGDEVGSSANAAAAGDEFLAEHLYPPNGGTLRIARSVLDVITGAAVEPRAIRAGELIRVRGIEGSVNALDASGRDGATVFRIASAEASGDGTATLELDQFERTEERAVADVIKSTAHTVPWHRIRPR